MYVVLLKLYMILQLLDVRTEMIPPPPKKKKNWVDLLTFSL